MDKGIMAMKTWNYHGGLQARLGPMTDMAKDSYEAKTNIRNKFFGGKDKISFQIQGSVDFNILDIKKQVNDYAKNKKWEPFWSQILYSTSTRLLSSIINNTKITNTYDMVDLLSLMEYSLSNRQNWPLPHFPIDDSPTKIMNLFSPSPKLTKQIGVIGRYLKLPLFEIDNCLKNIGSIQSFKPAKLDNVKLVLSVDIVDFITASLNDYNWSSCTTPEGCHANMSLALALDQYTIIAYIESEKSEFVLFKDDNGNAITGSNKKMQRYIHFNGDYSGAIMNKTYPNTNQSFNEGLIKIFKEMGFGPVEQEDKKDILLDSIIESHFVYDDIGSGDACLVVGSHSYSTHIGADPVCVHCGDFINEDDFEDSELSGRGVCLSCGRGLAPDIFIPYDEDDGGDYYW